MLGEPLQVVAQHPPGLEGLAAAAGVRPLARVVQLVDAQQRAGEEELATGEAVVALLAGVFGPAVAQQGARGDEALATVAAAEGALPRVDPLVGPPGVVVGEGLVAVGALVALLLGVAEPVHLQVVGDGEALPTVGAGERLLAHVEQGDVRPQVGRLGEPLPTGGADVRPLPCVRHHVRLEVGGLGEPLPTLGALVGLEARVRAVVQLQALQAGEALATLSTEVLLQALVGPLVAAQARGQLEGFATQGAGVGLPAGVGHLVQLQALGVAEALAALGARVALLSRVRLAVEIEALVGDEHLAAGFAAVAFLPLVHVQMVVQLLLDSKAVSTEPALEGFGARVHAVVRLQVPLQGKGLVTVGAAVPGLALMDLLVEEEAHHRGVQLAAVPALVGRRPLVAPLVGLQVSALVEAPVALGAGEHLPPGVGRAAAPRPLGPDVRMLLCGGADTKLNLLTPRPPHRSSGAEEPPRAEDTSARTLPRDKKSRPSSHRRQSVSGMDTFLRTGYEPIATSPSGSSLIWIALLVSWRQKDTAEERHPPSGLPTRPPTTPPPQSAWA